MVKRMDMKEMLGMSFEQMVTSKNALAAASEAELEARNDLKSSEAAIINGTDPKVLGANEAARTAALRARTEPERVALERAEKAKRDANLRYEIDCLAVDCLKWQIRADLAAKGMVI